MFNSFINQSNFPESGNLYTRNIKIDALQDFTYEGPFYFNYRTVRLSGALTQPIDGILLDEQKGIVIELEAGNLTFSPGDLVIFDKYGKELEFTIRSVDLIIDARNEAEYLSMNRAWPGLANAPMIYSIVLT